MLYARIAAALGLCLCLPVLAEAATRDPAGACGFAAESLPRSDLVLGHFRGGRIIWTADRVPLIVWRDEYNCFTSRRVCEQWQRKMQAAYRNVEGDRTCLPLR